MPLWILLSILTTPALGEEPSRVVAVGDLHGDLDKMRRALSLGGLIDKSDSWIGGSTVCVQVTSRTTGAITFVENERMCGRSETSWIEETRR